MTQPRSSQSRTFKRLALLPLTLALFSLPACSLWDAIGSDKTKPPLPGARISVLDLEKSLRPDAAAAAGTYNFPEAWQNETWPQAGGYPNHAMQNLVLGQAALRKVWTADIGEGSRGSQPLTAQPVVMNGGVFTLDTEADLKAFSVKDGKEIWSVSVRDPNEEDDVISGGVSGSTGILYVTAGFDEVLAVKAEDGKILWRKKLSGPSRAAPTVIGTRVFVTTLNNSLVALNRNDGAVLWEYSGLTQSAGLLGAASPAIAGDFIIPAFSSGEISALRAANGSVAWSDNLSGALRLGGLSGLSDIRGLPVVDNNIVYAISFGGKMAAIDISSGTRVWQKDIGGDKTPWIAGSRLFVISLESQMAALDAATGDIAWVSQLARFKDAENKKDPIFWAGPIMGGDRLLAFSSEGRVAEINPVDGTLVREWETGENIRIAPVIADGTLYLLAENGTLIAYR